MIINTHLLSAYGFDYGVYREARLRQLVEICDYVEQIDKQQIILGGDFNFDLNSPSYTSLIREYGFNDPLREIPGDTLGTDNLNRKFFLMDKVNQRLDYIFTKGFESERVTGNFVFKEPYTISGKPLHISDHYGVSVNMQ